jgi:hypothetical protein
VPIPAAPNQENSVTGQDLTTLILILEEEMLPEKISLEGALDMEAILDFAGHLSKLAHEYEAIGLISYAGELSEAVQNFDIKKTEKVLASFNNLINSFKK